MAITRSSSGAGSSLKNVCAARGRDLVGGMFASPATAPVTDFVRRTAAMIRFSSGAGSSLVRGAADGYRRTELVRVTFCIAGNSASPGVAQDTTHETDTQWRLCIFGLMPVAR